MRLFEALRHKHESAKTQIHVLVSKRSDTSKQALRYKQTSTTTEIHTNTIIISICKLSLENDAMYNVYKYTTEYINRIYKTIHFFLFKTNERFL